MNSSNKKIIPFIDKVRIKEYANEIAEWLISPDYVLPNGFLTKGVQGGEKRTENELDDLGDYLPFLFLFGKKDFCKNHIKLISKHLKGGILPPKQKRRGFSFVSSYEHSDFLLGLLDYYELTRDDQVKELLKSVLDSVIKKFRMGNLSFSYYIPSLRIPIPIFDTLDGMYIEILNQAAEILDDKKYFYKAQDLFKSMVAIPFFQKYGLFPFYTPSTKFTFPLHLVFPFLQTHFHEIVTLKNNTNTIFAFIDIYKKTKDETVKQAVYKWFESFKNYLLSKEGYVFDKLYEREGQFIVQKISLSPSFASLDLLCDAAHTFRDKCFLEEANKIVAYWLNVQSKQTGLFPQVPGEPYDNLDANTDMIVALKKFSELTNNKEASNAAERALWGILRYHRSKGGYVLSVDVRDGKVLNDFYKTKFIALFLKALYLFLENKSIYKSHLLFQVLKDR